ncbi:hypothetical protein BWG23_03395 [Flavobacterium oreochromis]|nr:hypothetical protein BWG23_03395 [Flavobacterium oreochromis]
MQKTITLLLILVVIISLYIYLNSFILEMRQRAIYYICKKTNELIKFLNKKHQLKIKVFTEISDTFWYFRSIKNKKDSLKNFNLLLDSKLQLISGIVLIKIFNRTIHKKEVLVLRLTTNVIRYYCTYFFKLIPIKPI